MDFLIINDFGQPVNKDSVLSKLDTLGGLFTIF